MSQKQKYVVGVDLGGTTIKTGLISEGGEIHNHVSVPSMAEFGPDTVVDQIVNSICKVISGIEQSSLSGIGVATPGMVSVDGNTVEVPPNFADWHSFKLKDAVEKRVGNRIPIKVENDANAAALAEAKFGAGRGQKNFLFVIWGTGVGGGIILDGEIYHGPYGGAGEIGHTSIDYKGPRCNCGNIGCVESFVGQRYLSKRAIDKLKSYKNSLVWKLVENNPDLIEPKILTDAAIRRDKIAREIMEEAGELLGVAITSVMNTLNFDLAIVGGGISAAGDLVFKPMNRRIKANVMIPLRPKARAIPARLGNDAGMLGAAGLVL